MKTGKFVIKPMEKGFMFEFIANNGAVVVRSAVYMTKSAAKKGISTLQRCAEGAAIIDATYDIPRDVTQGMGYSKSRASLSERVEKIEGFLNID